MSNSSEPRPKHRSGVRINPTQARGGVRRGVYKILIISTLLSVAAIIIAWRLTLPR